MDSLTTEEGATVYVEKDNGVIGSKGPFYVVYKESDKGAKYGYLCSACDTLNNAMDTMGRIVCNECGNTKKPDEWDAAHE